MLRKRRSALRGPATKALIGSFAEQRADEVLGLPVGSGTGSTWARRSPLMRCPTRPMRVSFFSWRDPHRTPPPPAKPLYLLLGLGPRPGTPSGPGEPIPEPRLPFCRYRQTHLSTVCRLMANCLATTANAPRPPHRRNRSPCGSGVNRAILCTFTDASEVKGWCSQPQPCANRLCEQALRQSQLGDRCVR